MGIKQKNRPLVFPRLVRGTALILGISAAIALYYVYGLYKSVFHPNVKKDGIIYITDNASYQQVLDTLTAGDFLKKAKTVNWVANKKKYPDMVKPGAYKLEKGWNNNKLINVLRSGEQVPIKVTFNNIRLLESLSGRLSKYFQADSSAFSEILLSPETAKEYGFSTESFPAMFIPNTYEFYWTTKPKKFVDRMKTEYTQFWSEERAKKASKIGFTPLEVTIIASIVQEETVKESEKCRIAGVYINRLKKGWPLGADPTIKFAIGDFSIKRILYKDLNIDSPYNTYKHSGLPPGPINLPDISSIDSVLNFEHHKYMYFCAREDFSGYHNFAVTAAQHSRNTKKYHNALNKNSIKR